jgi:hypothetical protein
MKKAVMTVLMGGLIALAGSACGISTAASPPAHHDGGNFLPAYLAQLQGRQPMPKDDGCHHPQPLADLLMPCDAGGTR